MSQWDLVDKKITELETRIDDLETSIKVRDTFISEFFAIIVEEIDLTSCTRAYAILSSVSTKEVCLANLESYIQREKKLFDDNPPELKEMLLRFFKQRMPIYHALILTYNITFNEFSEMMIKILGIELAKELFPLEIIIRLFGSENVQRWKEL